MPPKPQGPRPLTHAERQARLRQKQTDRYERWEKALTLIAQTCRGRAKEIAMEALEENAR